MSEKLDRRIVRTRRMLRDALLTLIVETGSYDHLTIDAITTRADVRRATFYLHYGSINDLLLDALSERFDQLAAEVEPLTRKDFVGGKTQVESFLVMFRHADEHRTLYRILFSSGSAAVITRRIRDYIAAICLRGLAQLPPERLTIPADVLAHSIAGLEMSLIGWWLETDSAYTPEAMAGYAHRLLLEGLKQAIGGGA
ncbi:MAG: TetR/AcrR family transcriptional regulator [Anaerolineae bacterium]